MTMTAREATMQTDLPLPGKRQGKVRDIYEATTSKGQEALVMIATDRMSAFDVVLPNGIPGKGIILTQISRFWFEMIEAHFDQEMDHHLISTDPSDIVGLSSDQIESLRGRTMVGRRCRVVPVECVVRGYLAGSGWRDYVKTQTVCGIPLPAGLPQSARLPEPIFTPATKATKGHDENISFAHVVEPSNTRLNARLAEVTRWREDGRISLPSTIELERATNPFLRTAEPAVIAASKGHDDRQSSEPSAVFASLRSWKDTFR